MRSYLGALALTSLVLAQTAMGAINLRPNYDFPYNDPYLSSLSVRLLQPDTSKSQTMMFDGLQGRDNVALLEGRAPIDVSVRIQKKPAPLVFIIPGMGGNATEAGVMWISENLYKKGFSTITMPSTFFWKFVLAQSSTAIPGFSPEDASDLRRLMVQAKQKAEQAYGLKATHVAAVGYSLGAINAAFVLKLEREKPVLGLERAVMINPPLNIASTIKTLDGLYALGHGMSKNEYDGLWGHVLTTGIEILSTRDPKDPNYFMGLDKALNISSQNLQFLIGDSFRQTLGDTIFTSQQITDVGLLKTKASSGSRTKRMNEAQAVSFGDYMQKVAWPYWSKRLGKSWTLDQFVAQGDLSGLKSWVAKEQGLRMMHNMDDFIVSQSDLQEFANLLGSRAVIYPRGGHVGNLWPEANRDDLYSMLSDLL